MKLLRSAAFAALTVTFLLRPAEAADDNLSPVTFTSVSADLKKQLNKLAVHDPLISKGCLDGGPDKHIVCSFQLGKFMEIMAISEKGKKDVSSILLICAGSGSTDPSKCLMVIAAAISTASPEIDFEVRSKIISSLVRGIDVGNEMIIKTDERKYILQRGAGLWFHVQALNAAD